MMKLRSNQIWTGIDLKLMPIIFLNPETNKLGISYSLFKRVPKGTNLTWSSGSSIGDACIDQGPDTPYVPLRIAQNGTSPSPGSDQLFTPLTQRLDPRAERQFEIPPFQLDMSSISVVKDTSVCKSSTPEKSPPKTVNTSSASNSSIRSNRSLRQRRSPITRPRKRYTPSPRASRLEKSRILDGEPPSKRTKLDRPKADKNRPKAKARKSLQRFLSSLFQH